MPIGLGKLGAGPAGDQDKCSFYRVVGERLFGVSTGRNCRKRNGYSEARQAFQAICKGKPRNGFLAGEGVQSQGTGFVVVVFLKMGDILACLYADGIVPIKRRGKLVMQEKMRKKGQGSSPLIDKKIWDPRLKTPHQDRENNRAQAVHHHKRREGRVYEHRSAHAHRLAGLVMVEYGCSLLYAANFSVK